MMSASNRTRVGTSPLASSVAPPASPRRPALVLGKYVLVACNDGTGREQRGVATVFVSGVKTHVRFRRIAMTGASRAVQTGSYELDPVSGDILCDGASVGRWQSTEGANAQLILVFIGATETWTRG